MQFTEIDQKSVNTIRFLSADAIQKANSGHPGLPMGAAPMAYVLWARHLKHNPAKPNWADRDRFVLSAGHGSMLLYSLLHLFGYGISMEDIKNFRQWDSRTPGHPENFITPGVEATTGPLGQGFANAVGMAIAEAHLSATFNIPGEPKIIDHFTFTLCGDGDLMEGIASESSALAGHLKLGKLIALFDDNLISLAGSTSLSTSEDNAMRFEAAGWQVLKVRDGNDLSEIDKAISQAKAETERPSIIMVRTVIGYGAPTKAASSSSHGAPLGEDELRGAKRALGWPEEPSFLVPDDVREHFSKLISDFEKTNSEWDKRFSQYSHKFPEKSAELLRRLEGQLPSGWNDSLPAYSVNDKPIATRKAGETCLNALAQKLPELIGGCADLSPSTFARLPGNGDFQNPTLPSENVEGKAGGGWDYSGRNIHFGVREHAMGASAVGMALHGGVRPFTGTFFVFADYMRPALRMAALSKLPVVFVFSHDSIGVGEDGPTHQPVEQLASLRAIPNLVTIRPADANETVEAWKVAIERKLPTALVFSRQNLPILDRTKFAPAEELSRGAYILYEPPAEPEIVITATGSEVSIAVEALAMLAERKISARIVSMPSWELFEAQPAEYREKVLPAKIARRIAVEAGIRQGWDRYIGCDGRFIGMNSFGASAPGKVLYEKFGITAENIAATAEEMMG
ncbi:MAG TPA: transketolase [candidate division Zixibacteria bacterium]|nr:transketolase [candidate division Zixibacteria bacterium]